MPKNEPTITGIKWIQAGVTRLMFSTGKTVDVSRYETVGWDKKLGDAPLILVNHQQYRNMIPKKIMDQWKKVDREYHSAKEEKSLAELVESDELISSLPVKKRRK